MVGWLIEQYNTIKKVIVVEREAFYCFFAKVSLGSVPEMPAESCREIKASEQGMAVSGRYWLEPRETGASDRLHAAVTCKVLMRSASGVSTAGVVL